MIDFQIVSQICNVILMLADSPLIGLVILGGIFPCATWKVNEKMSHCMVKVFS